MVIPVTVAAFAGALADVVTGTLNYWWLLWPSYPVMGISIWRSMSDKANAAWQARKLAERDAAAAARAAEAAATAAATPALVSDAPRVTVGRVADRLVRGIMHFGYAFTATIICILLIQAAIDIATWGRGYWYVYGPALALLAWFAWTVWRSGPADPKT